jgi:hypothetical protein
MLRILTLAVILLFASACLLPLPAVEIFVWEHDNGLRIVDPVFETSLTVAEAVTTTLDQLEMAYTIDASLPEDLGDYDVVVVALGFYCPT